MSDGYSDGYGMDIPAVPILGGGGDGWTPGPGFSERLPPGFFSTAENVGLGAAGEGGEARHDPMMIFDGEIITRPSGTWPNPADATTSFTDRQPRGVISGPPVLDPRNRVLIPEHVNSAGELVPSHWQHKPFSAIRLRVQRPANAPLVQQTATAAIVRVRASSPFGGGITERTIFLTPSMPACLMAGKYRNFEVSVLAITGTTQLAWEWFNDSSGVCAESKIWSETFTVAHNNRLIVPPGAVELFAEAPVFIQWNNWNVASANGMAPFDRAPGNSAPVPAGHPGTAVHGQELLVSIPIGLNLNDVNLQFRLSPI